MYIALEGFKKMSFFCEQYAVDYKSIFNSKKSKCMCLQNNSDMTTNINNCIPMKDGSSIEYVINMYILVTTYYIHSDTQCFIKMFFMVVFLFYLSVQIVYYINFQKSIVLFYLNCVILIYGYLW